jgi:hypothetical protein
MSYVSFEEFVKTRKWVESLKDSCIGFGDEDFDMPGFVYMNEYYIYDNSSLKDAGDPIPRYSYVVCNATGGADRVSDIEQEFYENIKGMEGWDDRVDIELRIQLKVPSDLDEKRIEALLVNIQEFLDNDTESGFEYEVDKSSWGYKI